jgi:hypothetical protein
MRPAALTGDVQVEECPEGEDGRTGSNVPFRAVRERSTPQKGAHQ